MQLRLSKSTFGWLAIALGVLSILAVGFLNPTHPPMELAKAYWPVYGAAVVLVALGVMVNADS